MMRSLGCCLALTLVLAVWSLSPLAQSPLGNSEAPLEISADKGIEWRREERVYIARGNARAKQGDNEIRADELRAYYTGSGDAGGDIYKVEAIGHVVVISPGGTAYGERAVYDVPSQVAVLTGGNLKLEAEDDIVTARDSLEYWQGKNLAVARGNAEVTRIDREKGTSSVIRADIMTAAFAEGSAGRELKTVDAFEAVEIITACEYITSDQARYLVPEQIAYLTGNVKITRGNNQLNGDAAEVNLATGISTLTGDRVQGLLVPNQDNDKVPVPGTDCN